MVKKIISNSTVDWEWEQLCKRIRYKKKHVSFKSKSAMPASGIKGEERTRVRYRNVAMIFKGGSTLKNTSG